MDLVEFLKIRAERYGSKTFLIGGDVSISYGEFDEITDRMAYGLVQKGFREGDHVAILHPNSPEVLLAYFAIIKAGCVVVPINSSYTPREIAFILKNSDAKGLLLHNKLISKIKSIQERIPSLKTIASTDSENLAAIMEKMSGSPLQRIARKNFHPDDRAVIFYTSGTTGSPKGVILTHGNFCFGGPNVAQNYGLHETDTTIAALPMVHVFSIASPFLGSLSSGGTVVVLEKFKPQDVLESIARYRVTWFPGVPTMFTYLLNAFKEGSFDISSLKMGVSGGASLPAQVLQEWEEKFDARMVEVYGLTESTGLVTANPVYGVRKSGSIGVTVSGVEARVVDEDGHEVPAGEIGELIFRGPNATRAYYKLLEETKEKIRDGWIYTGDHASRDGEGYFFIVGRAKELIISGGYNIYPREIEEVLHSYHQVNEVAVIGIKDPDKGEVPMAFVVLRKGHEVAEETLLSHCQKNLAPYKMPRIAFLDDLPKNATGKIMKKELPQAYAKE